MQADWPILTPYAILALAGGLVFCLGGFWRDRPAGFLWWLALAAAVASGLAALNGPARGEYLGLLDAGLYGRLFVCLIALLTVLTLLLLRTYASARDLGGEVLYGLVLLAALGMMLAAAAVNWLVFFLGLQMLSVCLYVLISVRREADSSLEAGLKYFCLGATAGAVVVFGIAMLYAAGGELAIGPGLAKAMHSGHGGLALLGLGLVLVGLAFKISLAPLHVWTPDVFQGAPAPISGFLAAGSKTAAAALLIRLCAVLPADLWSHWMPALWMLAALTMVVANVSALREDRAKRLLAFSSAAQMGYLVMALVGARHGGLGAALFFLAVYALMDLGVFGLLGVLSPLRTDLDRLRDMRGLARAFPWRAGLMVLFLLSLAGLPPTGGFVGKIMLFTAAISSGHAVLAVLGAVSAAAAFYYYFKLAATLYMEAPGEDSPLTAIPARPSPAGGLALGVIAAALLELGLFPNWLHSLATAALGSLS